MPTSTHNNVEPHTTGQARRTILACPFYMNILHAQMSQRQQTMNIIYKETA
jgi:hypothetical protein